MQTDQIKAQNPLADGAGHTFGSHAGAVQHRPRPVPRVGILQPLQQHAVQRRPDARRLLCLQPPPTGLAAAAQRRARHVLPRHARAQYQDDARQRGAIRRRRPPFGFSGSGGNSGAIAAKDRREQGRPCACNP